MTYKPVFLIIVVCLINVGIQINLIFHQTLNKNFFIEFHGCNFYYSQFAGIERAFKKE